MPAIDPDFMLRYVLPGHLSDQTWALLWLHPNFQQQMSCKIIGSTNPRVSRTENSHTLNARAGGFVTIQHFGFNHCQHACMYVRNHHSTLLFALLATRNSSSLWLLMYVSSILLQPFPPYSFGKKERLRRSLRPLLTFSRAFNLRKQSRSKHGPLVLLSIGLILMQHLIFDHKLTSPA